MKIFNTSSYLKAFYRAFCGFCPACNSDAPLKYDCPICKDAYAIGARQQSVEWLYEWSKYNLEEPRWI